MTTTRSLQDAIIGITAAISTTPRDDEDEFDAELRSDSARASWALALRYVDDAPLARDARVSVEDVPALRAWLRGVLA